MVAAKATMPWQRKMASQADSAQWGGRGASIVDAVAQRRLGAAASAGFAGAAGAAALTHDVLEDRTLASRLCTNNNDLRKRNPHRPASPGHLEHLHQRGDDRNQ